MWTCPISKEKARVLLDYGLIVDESSVVGQCLKVYVIEPVDDQVIIQLPRDTFTAGRRIRVPWEMVLVESA